VRSAIRRFLFPAGDTLWDRVPGLARASSTLARLVRGSPAFEEVIRAEHVFYINTLRAGMIAFDVGANLGECTLLFARLVGERGSVHAFEPTGAVVERLTTILRLSNLTNVQINRCAAAEKAGTVSFNEFPESHWTWNSRAVREIDSTLAPPLLRTEEVPAIPLDQYAAERRIEKIDLLKIDVEGSELQVLQGAKQLLREHKVDVCVFEVGHAIFDMGNRPAEIGDFLRDSGYGVRNLLLGGPALSTLNERATTPFCMFVARPLRR
jgi:FkbM family methyltransferase